MNLEKVVFGFFIVLALTLNFGFFIGDIDNPDHHDIVELFLAIVVVLATHFWTLWRARKAEEADHG